MQNATQPAAAAAPKTQTPPPGSDVQFYSPIGIQAVAAAAAQMRRSSPEASRDAANHRRDIPAVLRDDDFDA